MKEWSLFLCKTFLYLLIWGGFVAIITNMDKRTVDSFPIWANAIIVLVVFLAPFWLSKVIWNKGEQLTSNVSKQVKENIQTQQEVKEAEKSIMIYNEAKNRFKYLFNDVLTTKYKQYHTDKMDDMIKLALKEELVDRKLLPPSPMHEKLDAIMSRMK